PLGRVRDPGPDGDAVQDAVAVEQDGGAQAMAHGGGPQSQGGRGGAAGSPLGGAALRGGGETGRGQAPAREAPGGGGAAGGVPGGTMTQASATLAVSPPSRPTIPQTGAPTSHANCRARTRLGLTLCSGLPPPTERTRTRSRGPSLLTRSHSTKTVSHPSS